MVKRRRSRTIVHEPLARGGVSLTAAFTGFMVALGAMVVLTAIAAAVLGAVHARTDTLGHNATIRAAVAAVAGAAVVQLIAYTWGGYTAGRMGRGAGFANGLLVPVIAVVLGAIAVAIGWGTDVMSRVDVPFSTARFNLSHARITQLATALGIASLAGMFLGAAIGGGIGARWHTKLERRAAADTDTRTDTVSRTGTGRTVDLRDRTVTEEPADVETPARR